MDILYIGTLPPHKGAAAALSGKILTGLSRRGHRVRALSYAEQERESIDIYAAANPDITVERYSVSGKTLGPLAWHSNEYRSLEAPVIGEKLSSLLRERRPDIILLGREQYLWTVPDILAGRDVPRAVIMHGSGIGEVILDRQPEPFRTEFLDHSAKMQHIIVVARHFQEYMERLGFKNVHHIPNGIESDHFRPAAADPVLAERIGLDALDLVVIHVSNLKPVKRPLDIVDGAVQALKQDDRYRFLIVGDGPLLEQLKEYARSKGVIERFVFAGWVPRESVADYYNLAKVMLVTSEGEGQSLAQLEYQACGGTLIVADAPGARELVLDGETGLLFKWGDPASLAAALHRATHNKDLQLRIGEAARSHVLSKHTTEKMVGAYADLLEGLTR